MSAAIKSAKNRWQSVLLYELVLSHQEISSAGEQLVGRGPGRWSDEIEDNQVLAESTVVVELESSRFLLNQVPKSRGSCYSSTKTKATDVNGRRQKTRVVIKTL